MAEVLKNKLGASGVNLLHASGKVAGQSILHFHIHILPRFDDDKLDAWPKLPVFEGCREDIVALLCA